MELQIAYKCNLSVDRFKEKYSGSITLTVPGHKENKTIWFMLHFPHDVHQAEISLHIDENRTYCLAEGVGRKAKSGEDYGKVYYEFFGLDLKDKPDALSMSEFDIESSLGVAIIVTEVLSSVLVGAERYMNTCGLHGRRELQIEDDWRKEYSGPNESIATSFHEVFDYLQ